MPHLMFPDHNIPRYHRSYIPGHNKFCDRRSTCTSLWLLPPECEPWMKSKNNHPAGTAYIVGHVCRRLVRGKQASLFKICWFDSQIQHVLDHVSSGCVQRGVENYDAVMRLKNKADWQALVTDDIDNNLKVEDAS
ncbi:hypothetical protein PPTG_05420 [Phytophthora nicotianae INRA-310]|uniref:Uncharacterized protein n=1 Tax=Phytophthora nicotianae (strain INRA-310) TaxID=761204 RepID=W2QXJ8_PHYN3|nr:hypothetical protein PPTG_05420 [Phytophthora nicotianae INRA-310]ETN17676.1 hypothetical protein PPTG_05420 [Phytophthora nicotianae INRA-310]